MNFLLDDTADMRVGIINVAHRIVGPMFNPMRFANPALCCLSYDSQHILHVLSDRHYQQLL